MGDLGNKAKSQGRDLGIPKQAKKSRTSRFKLSIDHLHRRQHLLLLNERHVIFCVWKIIFLYMKVLSSSQENSCGKGAHFFTKLV